MHILTERKTVVQLLLKGDDYELLCPNNEDAWYNLSEIEEQPQLRHLLGEETMKQFYSGQIDFVVCRGNW